MTKLDLAALLPQLVSIVQDAGELIVRNSTLPKDIRKKGGNDLVTETDVAVEEQLKHRLIELLPESKFLAEESSAQNTLGDLTWVIDPLDGTTNFAHGLPFVATSVALWGQGRPVLGVINLPLLREVFAASYGGGAWCNGEAIHVSTTSELSQALVATGFPYDIKTYLPEILNNLEKFLPRTRGVRRPGAAALDLAYVACGRYDGFWESALHPWDTAAGLLLVTEAGGRVSQYDAHEKYIPGDTGILATNGLLHETMSDLLCTEA
ncbi:myo-inositol-1(or 4)-monophosphatase [Paucidesulfovibrio gracilis DSM 16080]|uniref:Inositol-1-monophosphatase n=1 Tax=Paucidesulfovibrio gracilis DSM 16080 TaxID=1121449 RepID=A0A1T4WPV5_9BACT|nr:myo-inositol-1(or 4)-monophosphatase [Paucidesulfovibrio gracilis DSM 16080]